MSATIRIADETYSKLARLKGDDETFDELVSRLLEHRKKRIRKGAGLWSESDAADAAREARLRLKQNHDQ